MSKTANTSAAVTIGNTTSSTSNAALQAALDSRLKGETWATVSRRLGVPDSTLRGRMYAAGLITRSGQPIARGKSAGSTAVAAAAAPVAAAVVQPVLHSFVPPSWYGLLKFAMQHERGVTMFGPRGCGKSTAIRELAVELSAQTVTMQCAANMQIDSLIGSWTSTNGTLSFIDGPLTTAVRNGTWLLAEEANVIHPGVWSAVNTLTDQTGEGLRLPTGEVVKPNPSFRLVLIYNEGYAGTREVNAALKDRLMPIYCGYLEAADEIKLLAGKTAAPEAECKRVQDVATMIRAANLRFDLSPRSLVRWIKLVKTAGYSWAKAFECAIIDLVGPKELAGPQRACLEEIARNTIEQWNRQSSDDPAAT